MKKIYSESIGFFLSSFPALLAFAATIEIALWVFQPKSEFSVSFVALTIVAYYFHRHFLFGEVLSFRKQKPGTDAPPQKFGWFILVSAALVLVPIGVALAIAFSYRDRPTPAVFILILMPIYLVTLSLFGTALPATVARDGSYRLSQGLRATFSTMWRLVVGPGVIGVLLIVAMHFAGNALGALGVSEGSPWALAFFILVRTLGFLTTIFAVAVLCAMYRGTRPEPHIPQDPGPFGQTPA